MNAAYMTAQANCSSAVAKAVSEGLLPPARTQKCVDCGKRARCYDHRDYNKPLDVSPVCQSCNVKRGPAVFVKPKGFIVRDVGIAIKVERKYYDYLKELKERTGRSITWMVGEAITDYIKTKE